MTLWERLLCICFSAAAVTALVMQVVGRGAETWNAEAWSISGAVIAVMLPELGKAIRWIRRRVG